MQTRNFVASMRQRSMRASLLLRTLASCRSRSSTEGMTDGGCRDEREKGGREGERERGGEGERGGDVRAMSLAG